MTAAARFDLKMDAEEKETLARAAALMGMTMAAFVRKAANEKAHALLEQETKVTMTTHDFKLFTAALETAFEPNAALQQARRAAREVKRA